MFENLPKENRLSALCSLAIRRTMEARAAQLASKAGRTVYAFPTRKGPAYDIVPPLGWCLVAQPSGVITEKSAPVV